MVGYILGMNPSISLYAQGAQQYAQGVQISELNKGRVPQDEINRVNSMQFAPSAQATDPRKVFQYLARADGRRARAFRPASLDPLRDTEISCWRPTLRGKANLPGSFFARKMAQISEGKEVSG